MFKILSFAKVVERIQNGIERFWIFHLSVFLAVIVFIQSNHDMISSSTAINLIRGVCWGALSGLFVQLLGEWKGWKSRKLSAVIVTVLVGVLGCWFWSFVGKDSPRYGFLVMLYSGTVVSLTAASVYVLFQYCEERSLAARLAVNAFGAGACAIILALSLILCVVAFSELVASVGSRIYADLLMMSYAMTMSIGFLSFLPDGKAHDDAGTSDKAAAFLFWLLLPASLLLLLILYIYIGKSVFEMSMPSGELNWFGSAALAVYVFFWLSLRGLTHRFFKMFVRWGWVLLLPVLAAQITGVAIRYHAYGLTTPRFAGMITLLFGIVALFRAALRRHPQGLFLFIAVTSLIFTLTPLNIIDVPVWNQERRLKAALERNGLLDDGKVIIKSDAMISNRDAEIIVGAWRYLVPGGRKDGYSRNWNDGLDYLGIKPTVWYRPSFTAGLRKGIEEHCREHGEQETSLPKLLGINVTRFRGRNHLGMTFKPSNDGKLPIEGYSHIKMFECWSDKNVECRKRKGRWIVAVPAYGKNAAEEFDVTESVLRMLGNAGCDGTISAKSNWTIDAADAVWPLQPGKALVIGKIYIYGREGEGIEYFTRISPCGIVTKPEVDK